MRVFPHRKQYRSAATCNIANRENEARFNAAEMMKRSSTNGIALGITLTSQLFVCPTAAAQESVAFRVQTLDGRKTTTTMTTDAEQTQSAQTTHDAFDSVGGGDD